MLRVGIEKTPPALGQKPPVMREISESKIMTSTPPPVQPPESVPALWPGLLLTFAASCITIGIMWDISWHETIGRDTFWTPAHMAIYLGGALGGCVGGWLAVQYTFLASPMERAASVWVFGARAPLGAWVAIWGAVAMITSGPFDNWWHNAYGLDVKIISPPHALLGLGMFGIIFGALLLVLTRQNRLQDGAGSGLFVYVGGIFLVIAGVFVMEYTFPNMQHAAIFYQVCAVTFPFRMVALGRAGRTSWPVTRVAVVYIIIECLVIWILPLFPAQPRLAPIFNPVTRMVPPPFPLLLIFPALAIDLVLRQAGEATSWKRLALALVLGVVFLAVFVPVQWFFAKFLISPQADNWFFVGNRVWSYGTQLGGWNTQFWRVNPSSSDVNLLTLPAIFLAWALAAATSWLGLLLGGWMRKVQR
jgi:hypothetical protein